MSATVHHVTEDLDLTRLRNALASARGVIREVHASYPAVAEIELVQASGEPRVLSTEGSSWTLQPRDGPPLQSDSLDDPVAALAEALKGRQVVRVDVDDRSLDLVVDLDDGRRLLIEAKSGGRDGEALIPFWELRTPDTIVGAGPGYWTEYSAKLTEDHLPWARDLATTNTSRRARALKLPMLVRTVLITMVLVAAFVLAVVALFSGGEQSITATSQLLVVLAVVLGFLAVRTHL